MKRSDGPRKYALVASPPSPLPLDDDVPSLPNVPANLYAKLVVESILHTICLTLSAMNKCPFVSAEIAEGLSIHTCIGSILSRVIPDEVPANADICNEYPGKLSSKIVGDLVGARENAKYTFRTVF